MERTKSSSDGDQFTVCVLGGGAAGKSSIIVRYINNAFDDNGCNDPTLLDEYVGRIPFRGRECMITFMDTAGQSQYAEHRNDTIANAHAYLLIYDVTTRVSFEEVQEFINDISRVRLIDTRDLPIVILANKMDAPDRDVDADEGQALAREAGCPLIEVSAKTGLGVEESLNVLMSEIAYYWWKGKEACMYVSRVEMCTKLSDEERVKRQEDHKHLKWRKRWCALDGAELQMYRVKKKSKSRLRTRDSLGQDNSTRNSGQISTEHDNGTEKERKGKLDETVDLSGVLGVKKARNETGKINAFLMITPVKRYYLVAEKDFDEVQVTESRHQDRKDWIRDIRNYSGKAQYGASIGNGARYDTLNMPKLPKPAPRVSSQTNLTTSNANLTNSGGCEAKKKGTWGRKRILNGSAVHSSGGSPKLPPNKPKRKSSSKIIGLKDDDPDGRPLSPTRNSGEDIADGRSPEKRERSPWSLFGRMTKSGGNKTASPKEEKKPLTTDEKKVRRLSASRIIGLDKWDRLARGDDNSKSSKAQRRASAEFL